MATIFLSHSSVDSAAAIAVRDWLRGEGWDDVFLDLDPEGGIKAGERWQEALKRASSRCELVIFLISPAWVASKWCLTEFLLAKQMNKRIVAAVVEPTPFESIPVEMSAEWQIVDLTAGVEKCDFSVALPTSEQPEVVRFAVDGLERLKTGLLASGLDPKFFPWPPEHDPERAPYRGLRALEEEDAGIFFGRDGPIVDGLDLLRGLREAAPPRMLVILGASGAGKSSFMRAGLLPRLRRDSRHYRVLPVVRPHSAVQEGGAGLISGLDRALRDVGQRRTRVEIRAACAGGAVAVAELLAPLARTTSEECSRPLLVLPIDQGEELFLADGADEARTFLRLLYHLLRLEDIAIAVLVTIRSDSYEPLQSAPALEGIVQRTYSLPPMPRGAYGEVIHGPARRLSETVGSFEIEGTLETALLGDIGESAAKDALPLLAFTLERLYREYGADGKLTLAEYEEMGRIRGSIEAAVEQALKAADGHPDIPRERAARLRLLRRAMIPALAGVDPDSGTPRRRVARLGEIPDEARPLVQLLIDQRLLATDVAQETGETTVEPAHEALLRQWSTLEGWLEEEAEDLAMAESVRRAARDWQANGREGEWLVHAGGRLQLAERVARREDFTSLFGAEERAYLDACREAEQARRAAAEAARRHQIRFLAGALAVSLVLLAFAGWQWREAGLQREEAEAAARTAVEAEQTARAETERANAAAERARRNAAGGLAALAEVEARRRNWTRAVKLALASWPRKKEAAVERIESVIDVLARSVPPMYERVGRGQGTADLAGVPRFSPDGRFYTYRDIGSDELTLVDVKSGRKLGPLILGLGTEPSPYAFSPDSKYLAYAKESESIRIIALQDGDWRRDISYDYGDGGVVISIAFSSNGANLVSANEGGQIWIWEIPAFVRRAAQESGRGTREYTAIWQIAASKNAEKIAATTSDGVIHVFENGVEVITVGQNEIHGGHLLQSGFFDNDSLFFMSGFDRLLIFDAADFSRVKSSNLTSAVSYAFRRGRSEIAAAADPGGDGVMHDVPLPGTPLAIAISATEDSFLGTYANGTLRLVRSSNSHPERPMRVVKGAASAVAVSFIGEGNREFALGYHDGSARALGVDEFAAEASLVLRKPVQGYTVLSEDGRYAAYRSTKGLVVIDPVLEEVDHAYEWKIPEEERVLALSDGASVIATSLPGAGVRFRRNGADAGVSAGRILGNVHGISPDGTLFASASNSRYWLSGIVVDTSTGEEVRTFEHSAGGIPLFVQFSQDNTNLIIYTWDGIVTIDLSERNSEAVKKFEHELDGHRWSDHAVPVARGGRAIIASDESRLRVIDEASGRDLAWLSDDEMPPQVQKIGFPREDRVVALSRDGALYVWNLSALPQGNIFDVACALLPDHMLDDVTTGSPIRIDEPICGEDYDPPLPEWIGRPSEESQETQR